jgi:galactose mutarotase-like enzyme
MEQELWSGPTKAIVDPMGAWLTNLSDDNGDILYPKRAFQTSDGTKKDRGGLFVCLPNFGPGGSSSLAQHGFGRTQAWDVLDKTEASILLKLQSPEGEYAALNAVLSYQLNDHLLMAALDLTNDGDHDLRIAPAFHPYFATGEGAVKVNGEEQSLDELADTVFVEGEEQEIDVDGRVINCESQQLGTWAKWTDQLGPYMCVEPTLAGYSFLNDTPKPIELLKPGETRTFSLTLTWR